MKIIKKNKTLLVAKKEWDRFFGDRRLIIGALIFPGLLLYLIYAVLAPLIISMYMGNARDLTVYVINPPLIIQRIFENAGIHLSWIYENEKEIILEGIAEKNGNFLIVFPENFIEEVEAFDVRSGEIAPKIHIYYNSLSDGFAGLYGKIISTLQAYERSLTLKFEINRTDAGDIAFAPAPELLLLAAIVPMFVLVFIFQGAMATTTEAITGEKERGTFATIFITSITPMELAAGKIFGLGIESFLCGISGTLGLILAMPRFIDSFTIMLAAEQGLTSALNFDTFSLDQYGISDLGLLVLLLLSTSCFIVTIIAIVSIHAKTAKEAQLLVAPLLIVFLFISSLNIFSPIGPKAIHYYFIPIYNSVQSMSDILNQSHALVNVLAAIGINVFLVSLGCFILSRLIRTEKIMNT